MSIKSYTLTFGQVYPMLCAGSKLETLDGHILPATDLVKSAMLWIHDVGAARCRQGVSVPDHVLNDHNHFAPIFVPPEIEEAIIVPEKTIPHFATSFSGMEEFLICPRKWAASKYYKTVPYEEGPEAAWGNRVHKTAENYLLSERHLREAQGDLSHFKRLPTEAECLSLVKRYCDHFLNSGAQLHIEKEICCTKDLKPCGWKDWNTVWFRGKGDLFALKDGRLTYLDWKSGKKKLDTFQIEVMIALADLHFGDQVDTYDGKMVFVKESDPKKALVGLEKPILKSEIPKIWEKIFAITNRMEQSWQSENFRCTSNGLCRAYCGDKTCPHNGRR